MKIPSIIQRAALYPENYFSRCYYDCYVSMIEGYDACCEGKLLLGFSDWILSKTKDKSEYSGCFWARLVLLVYSEGIVRNCIVWPESDENHLKACQVLLKALNEYHQTISDSTDHDS